MHATEDLGSTRHGWETPVSATRAAVVAQPQHGDGRTAPALPAPCSAPPRPPCQALPAPYRAPPPRAVHLHPVRYTSTTRARYVPAPCHVTCTPLEEVARAHHGENSFSYSELYRCVFCFLHVRLFNIYIRGAHTPPAQPTHRCQAGRSGTPPVTKARRRPRRASACSG